ncbi:MAG: alkylation repair enzyme [Patescibacteria group bacterium]|nr:alkylation repair enzyme [Patescibacteria group bacterium]
MKQKIPQEKTNSLQIALRSHADPARAHNVSLFFKTAPGQYGHGDRFLGLSVPQVRACVKSSGDLSWPDIKILMKSPWHEERLAGVIVMSEMAKGAASVASRAEVCKKYLSLKSGINNWYLVDASASNCVGMHLEDLNFSNQKKFLESLIVSQKIWDRRIAMIATFHMIKSGDGKLALWVSQRLLNDEHDLMHKAVGWMLREVGKRASVSSLELFLKKHSKTMPRTMLRYAIERFPEPIRKAYLSR